VTQPLALIEPGQLVARNQDAVRSVAAVIKQHYTATISGKRYLMVAGAQAIGSAMGYTCAVTATRYVQATDGLPGYWEAVAEVLLGGVVVGRGVGMVADDEAMWRTRPHFARQAMAQTRATGRALKGVIGWATALVGTESSLAEEMHVEAPHTPQEASAAPRRLPAPSSTEKALGGKAAPAKPKQTIVAIVQQVDAKTSKAGKPYWRLAVEAGEGTEWFTSFKAVDEAVIGKRMTLVLGTTAKGDTVIDDVYEAVDAEEVPF
jgi:hypothetical protein